MKLAIASIISNTEVMPDVYLVWLESPQIAAKAKPGQFVMVRCGNECVLPRPFSIYQPNDKGIILLYKLVGKGTCWLSQQKEGETVELFGPLGNSFTTYSASKNLLLVAGGIGIAPLSFLVKQTLAQNYNIRLLMGSSSSAQLLPTEELPTWAIIGLGINIMKATEDGTVGYQGMITDLLPDFTDWADQVFACGPLPMYKAMAQMPELKDKPVQVSLEVRMGCGRGVCYGCTIKTRQGLKKVCQDGPVFDLDDILWDELNL